MWSGTNKEDEPTIEVVAVATGNRCVGKHRQAGDDEGRVVVDCHAEVLVRRCFRRLLYDELMLMQQMSSDESLQTATHASAQKDASLQQRQLLVPFSSSFTSSTSSSSSSQSLYRLNPAATLHLVISQTPCGDGSIYPIGTDSTPSVASSAPLLITPAYNWTGAKPTISGSDTRDRQLIGCQRTKSSRSDALLERRCESFSCSDKLALWCHVGLCGSMLGYFVEPVWLTSVVLLLGHMDVDTRENARMATQRALIDRFQKEGRNELMGGVIPTIQASPLVFPKCKAAVLLLSSLSSSSTSSSSQSAALPLKKKRKRKLSTPSGYAIISVKKHHEVLISSKGILQGQTETTKKKRTSVIARSSFAESFRGLGGGGDGGGGGGGDCLSSYSEFKQRIAHDAYRRKKKSFVKLSTYKK